MSTKNHECAVCGEGIPVDYYKLNRENPRVGCPSCSTSYDVDVDAEFVDGSWRDLTKIIAAGLRAAITKAKGQP